MEAKDKAIEIKTTQEITGRLTRPNERNIKWIPVEEVKKIIDKLEDRFLVQRDNTEPLIVIHYETEWKEFKKKELGYEDGR